MKKTRDLLWTFLKIGAFTFGGGYAMVALLVVAAFITPSSDPFTLMSVFIPIYILWELSAFLVKPAQKDISDD